MYGRERRQALSIGNKYTRVVCTDVKVNSVSIVDNYTIFVRPDVKDDRYISFTTRQSVYM